VNSKTGDLMDRPALAALALLAQGRAIVEINSKRRCGYLAELDGRAVSAEMRVPGVWALAQAGCIDQYGVVTALGHKYLSAYEQVRNGTADGLR
jgi:hypothetical protein